MYYNIDLTPSVYISSLPGKFPDIEGCLVQLDLFHTQLNCWHVEPEEVRYGLIVEKAGDALRPGFPSLNHVTHRASLEQRGIKVRF